jgi:hypothetical protein
MSGQLLREHTREVAGRRRTAREDRPAPVPPGVHDLLARAERAGEHIGKLCRAIYEREGDLGARRMLGVLTLARRLGVATVEDASAAALEMGVPTYRFVRRYLDRRPSLHLTLRQVDPLIRELTQYRDLVEHLTTPKENDADEPH